jgi:VWFA-related protein
MSAVRLAAALFAAPFTLAAIAYSQAPLTPFEPDVARPSTPVFRSAAEAIAVDVVVTDQAGGHVRGLTVDDFEILENGKPQPVTTFRAVDVPLGSRELPPPAEADVVTNDRPDGRVFVFAVAVNEPDSVPRVRALLKGFLEREFGPHDVGAVVMLGRGLATDGQDFTSNRRLLLQAVDKITIASVTVLQPHIVVRSLREVIEVLGEVAGRHKSLLYFIDHPNYAWGDLLDYRGGVGSLTFLSPQADCLDPDCKRSVMGHNSLMFDDAHAAMRIATRTNLTVYPIDPRGLTSNAAGVDGLHERDDLRAMAQLTGGFAVVNSNEFDAGFQRIMRDASTFYMLGFNSAYTKTDGKFVRVEVRVKKPGVTVRARSGYVNATASEAAAVRRTAVSRNPVVQALASPLTLRGHPIRIVATPYRGPNDKAIVVMTLETQMVRKGSVQVRYIVTDAHRKIYPEIRHVGTLPVASRVADATGDRVRLVADLELPPGRYQIRGVVGTEKDAGSVIYDLEVPNFRSETLMVSGVALTQSDGADLPTIRPVTDTRKIKTKTCRDSTCTAPEVREVPLTSWLPEALPAGHPLLHALPGPPTTKRTFRRADTVTVFTEVYDDKPPRALEGRVSLLRPDGSAVLSLHAPLSVPSEPRRAMNAHRLGVKVPLADVPAGQYALRVDVRTATDSESAARDILIEVSE